MYNFTVMATENTIQSRDGLMGIATVIVEITDANDNPPIFTPSTFFFTVPENQPPLTFVGNVTAQDRDTGSNALVC